MKLTSISRMRLRDILVLRIANITEDEEPALTQLAENLSGLCRVPIILLRDGQSVETLSEADMAKAGWVRIERRSPNGG